MQFQSGVQNDVGRQAAAPHPWAETHVEPASKQQLVPVWGGSLPRGPACSCWVFQECRTLSHFSRLWVPWVTWRGEIASLPAQRTGLFVPVIKWYIPQLCVSVLQCNPLRVHASVGFAGQGALPTREIWLRLCCESYGALSLAPEICVLCQHLPNSHRLIF